MAESDAIQAGGIGTPDVQKDGALSSFNSQNRYMADILQQSLQGQSFDQHDAINKVEVIQKSSQDSQFKDFLTQLIEALRLVKPQDMDTQSKIAHFVDRIWDMQAEASLQEKGRSAEGVYQEQVARNAFSPPNPFVPRVPDVSSSESSDNYSYPRDSHSPKNKKKKQKENLFEKGLLYIMGFFGY